MVSFNKDMDIERIIRQIADEETRYEWLVQQTERLLRRLRALEKQCEQMRKFYEDRRATVQYTVDILRQYARPSTTVPQVPSDGYTSASREKHSILELRGLGKKIWQDIDAQEYVDQERASWGG